MMRVGNRVFFSRPDSGKFFGVPLHRGTLQEFRPMGERKTWLIRPEDASSPILCRDLLRARFERHGQNADANPDAAADPFVSLDDCGCIMCDESDIFVFPHVRSITLDDVHVPTPRYSVLLEGLSTPIQFRFSFARRSGTYHLGEFEVKASHAMQTPMQHMPHRNAKTWTGQPEHALGRMLDLMYTGHLSTAVAAGHQPSETWLVPNDGF